MFFIALFTLEMLLKMYSLGFQVSVSFNLYHHNGFHKIIFFIGLFRVVV